MHFYAYPVADLQVTSEDKETKSADVGDMTADVDTGELDVCPIVYKTLAV